MLTQARAWHPAPGTRFKAIHAAAIPTNYQLPTTNYQLPTTRTTGESLAYQFNLIGLKEIGLKEILKITHLAADKLDKLIVGLEASQLFNQLFHCFDRMHRRQRSPQHRDRVKRIRSQ